MIPKILHYVLLRPLILCDVRAVQCWQGLQGRPRLPTCGQYWPVMQAAQFCLIKEQSSDLNTHIYYLLSLTAHLPLSRTRRRMSRAKWLFIALAWGHRRSGNGGIRGYAMMGACTCTHTRGGILDMLDCSRLLAPQFLNCTLAYFKMP